MRWPLNLLLHWGLTGLSGVSREVEGNSLGPLRRVDPSVPIHVA